MNIQTPSRRALHAVLVSITFTSCEMLDLYTGKQLEEAQALSYQEGISNGSASEVRSQYHREQQKKELPPPPLEKKYYKVPMGGYQTPEGLWIESHDAIIEVVQP